MQAMREPTLRELAAEIAALRRSRRRGGLLLLVAGLAIGATSTAGAGPSAPALDVRSLVLRDDVGNARAKLSMAEGGPRLAFADAAGRARLVLGEDRGDNPFVAIADAKGIVRIWVTIEPFGPSINMKDAAGAVRASLTVVSADLPANEGPRWELFDPKRRQPRVVLEANEVRAGIGVGAGTPGPGTGSLAWTHDAPRLDLVGAEGSPLFRAP